LRNVSVVVEPGGAIHIVGWILDDSRVSPADVAVYKLMAVASFDQARLYTESEIRAWLAEAGFPDAVRARSFGTWGTDSVMAYKPTF
jgi:hypothetical protein